MFRSLGLFSEEALESMHAKLNRLERRTFGIRNQLSRLKKRYHLLEDAQHPETQKAAQASRDRSKRKPSRKKKSGRSKK